MKNPTCAIKEVRPIPPALILWLGLLGGSAGWAQTPEAAVRQWYDRETIHLLGPTRYVRNNTVYNGASQLQKEFNLSPGGMELYVRSRRNRNIALVVSLAGSAGTIYTLATGNRDNYKTFFWVSLGTGLASTLFTSKANAQLNQAVWLRNRDALLFLDNASPR